MSLADEEVEVPCCPESELPEVGETLHPPQRRVVAKLLECKLEQRFLSYSTCMK